MRQHLIYQVTVCLLACCAIAAGLPHKPRAMNHFVTELVNASDLTSEQQRDTRFVTPRDGWIFIACQVTTLTAGETVEAIIEGKGSPDQKRSVTLRPSRSSDDCEAMCYLPKGEHVIRIGVPDGANVSRLIVRAIPEILYAEIGYALSPNLKSYGPYRMPYLQRIGLLDNMNVLIERERLPEDQPLVEQWRADGKRVIEYSNLLWMNSVANRPLYEWKSNWAEATAPGAYYTYWSERNAMNDDGYIGIVVDEVDANYGGLRPEQTASLKRILEDPKFANKHFYAYSVRLFEPDFNREFVNTLLKSGRSKLVEELYIAEPSLGEDPERVLDEHIKVRMQNYRKAFGDIMGRMILNFGYFNAPPESLDINPSINWKTWIDMQFHMAATDPTFAQVYGVMAYHSFSADDEAQRWMSKLYRHYCIEGNTKRASSDPLVLRYLRNPDFNEDLSGWNVSPAERDSIAVRKVDLYAYMQGRTHRDQSCPVLCMKRSSKAPNRISQEVRGLVPGRLYSLKLFSADHGDIVNRKSTKTTHPITIQFDGAELLPDASITETFGNAAAGHVNDVYHAENQLYITYRALVYRATQPNGKLTLSDWASETEPGGRTGQELMHNFIQLQPFYAEDDEQR